MSEVSPTYGVTSDTGNLFKKMFYELTSYRVSEVTPHGIGAGIIKFLNFCLVWLFLSSINLQCVKFGYLIGKITVLEKRSKMAEVTPKYRVTSDGSKVYTRWELNVYDYNYIYKQRFI